MEDRTNARQVYKPGTLCGKDNKRQPWATAESECVRQSGRGKRKHSDSGSTRRKSSESRRESSRRWRKDDARQVKDSSSDSSCLSESEQSSSEFETTKKKHKKREKKKKSKSKHSKKTKKHRKKKKSKSKEIQKQKDSKMSEKKDLNVEHSGRQLKDCLQSGPQQSKVVSDTSEPLPKKKRPMAPMTKEEYEKQQSVVRRVYDPETGRHRLVKGDGEIIEEIVSQQRHREINKTATRGDGAFFQAALGFSDK